MEQKPKFRVKYHRQAQEYLNRLDAKTRMKIIKNVDMASFTLNPELLKKLTGDVWEFRTLYNGKHYRMLAFWDKRNNTDTLVIATHGFIKKVSGVPKKEIERAERIMNEYFNQ